MEKLSFIDSIEKMLEQEDLISLGRDAQDLRGKFYDYILEKERVEQVKQLEAKEKGTEYTPVSFENEKDAFKISFQSFQEKRKKQLEIVKILEEENLKQKRSLIERLKQVIENEEKIGAAFSIQKEIHETWKKTGEIPRVKRDEIQKEYSRLMELFFYNIKIYRELKEHDYHRNSQLKKEKIKEIQSLLNLKSIKEVEDLLRKHQDEWEEIGPVPNEEWEKIKESYWEAVKSIYDKINKFYSERRSAMMENIERKKDLIEQIKIILASIEELDHLKKWGSETNKIKDLQQKWKQIGFGPRKENDAVWKEFRGHCDAFFAQKKAFNKQLEDHYSEFIEKKKNLIEKAKSLCESKDWEEATNEFIRLQRQWKKIGNAGPRHENKLWKAFRKPCDQFFNSKEEFEKTLEKEKQENVVHYEKLIKSIKEFSPSGETKEDLEKLKNFSIEYKQLGGLPNASRKEIYNSFKKSLDQQYNKLKLSPEKKEIILYKSKIDAIPSGKNRTTILSKEKTQLKKNIERLTNEMLQIERNLSFFSQSKGSQKFIEQTQEKINLIKNKIELQKKLMRAIPNE